MHVVVYMIAPVDSLFRTVVVEAKLNRIKEALGRAGGIEGKEFWLTGGVDGSAREMPESSCWTIIENAESRLMKNR